MREVHYYVHGRGRGHATRALVLVPALEAAGYRVRLFAGRDARPLLLRERPCAPVHSLMPGEPFLTVPKLLQRTLWAGARGLNAAPAAVISDGDMPSVIASAAVGLPTLALGHGLLFHLATAPSGLDAAAWGREARKAGRASVGSTRQVALGFFPMALRSRSARLARSPLPQTLGRAARRGGVVCYFRDERGASVLEALRAFGITPELFSTRDPCIPGVLHRPLDRAAFLTRVLEADAVISSAGYQLLSECLTLGVPHFALYAANDDEQRLNVELLHAAELGDGCAFESVRSRELFDFLGKLGEVRQLRRESRLREQLPDFDEVVLDVLAEITR